MSTADHQSAKECTAASLTIAESATLGPADSDLLMRALDVLDRDMQVELSGTQDAAAGHTRSRILITRAKLLRMQGGHVVSDRHKARPKRAQIDQQAMLRELQKALAVTRCIRFAAEYDEHDEVDLADALAGLLVLMEEMASLLDEREVRHVEG